MTASEAKACHLVTEVFPRNTFEENVAQKISQFAAMPPQVCTIRIFPNWGPAFQISEGTRQQISILLSAKCG